MKRKITEKPILIFPDFNKPFQVKCDATGEAIGVVFSKEDRPRAYFSKKLAKEHPNFQIDLIFNRADHVLTVCEIKYLQRKVDISIIEEFERKLSLLPNPKKRTLHKVLIAANGATDKLINRHYFDQIITLDDFFN